MTPTTKQIKEELIRDYEWSFRAMEEIGYRVEPLISDILEIVNKNQK